MPAEPMCACVCTRPCGNLTGQETRVYIPSSRSYTSPILPSNPSEEQRLAPDIYPKSREEPVIHEEI